MKIGKWARLFLALAPLLSGCSGFWDASSSSSGSGGGTGTASGVFYVLNQKTAQIAGYSFPSGSTTPTAITGSPVSLGTVGPLTMAVSPNGSFLYLGTAAGIFAYSINSSSGVLTLINGGQVISSDTPYAMQVDASGGWLIDAISGLAALNAIPLDSTTGLVVSGASEQSVNLPSGATAIQQIAVTPSGATNSYVFVAMGTAGTAVIPFDSSASTSDDPFGNVGTIKPITITTGASLAVAVDVSRPLLYVGETLAVSGNNPGGLRVFTIGANSTLAELTGSSYPYATGGVGPSAILPTTSYVYVANKTVSGSTPGNITGFSITSTGTTYSLTAITSGTISAGTTTMSLAEENTGTYILAVNATGSPDLNAFTISSTGALTSYATAATGTDPVQAIQVVAVP